MPKVHKVRQGDCIESIAYAHGHFWETLWDDRSNAALKQKRKDPNVLQAGDKVHVPNKRIKKEAGSTEKCHRFKMKGVPSMLRIQTLHDDQPLVICASLRCNFNLLA